MKRIMLYFCQEMNDRNPPPDDSPAYQWLASSKV